MNEKEKNILLEFYRNMVNESVSMPIEFSKIVDEHFDELIN